MTETPRPRSETPPEPCGVPGCASPSLRHLAAPAAHGAYPELPEKGHSVPLCRTHYKEWKKKTKEARALDRLAW